MRKMIWLAVFSFFSCTSQQETVSVQEQKQVAENQQHIVSGNGYAVVELFTSEGCTSCPFAEAILPKLKDQYKDKISILAFHVDYWDRENWRDSFSNKEYSARQKSYADHFDPQGGVIFTPQVMVNGKGGINGSNRKGIESSINTELLRQPGKDISLTVSAIKPNSVALAYSTKLASNEVLHIALVQLEGSRYLKIGDNSGRQLEHTNIVRFFETVKTNSGSVTISLPKGLATSAFHIIAYTQNKANFDVTGMEEIPVEEALSKN